MLRNTLITLVLLNLSINSATAAEQAESAPLVWQISNPFSEPTDPPPKAEPYKLPRFDGSMAGDHYTAVPPIRHAPAVDAEALYHAVLSCYPERSKFSIEIDLEGAYRDRRVYDSTGSQIGQHYIGIVARMPLYSSTELSRERDREYKRRTDTADTVARFMQALADRNHAHREIGLYSSLEARAQVRVAQGIAMTEEQVRYLEKVAKAQRSLIQSETDLIKHRLALVGQCSDTQANRINGYIKELAYLPPATTPSTGGTQ